MSFLDEARQGRQRTMEIKSAERKRLVRISQGIIRDTIGHNYRATLLKQLKDRVYELYSGTGEIKVLRFECKLKLDQSVSECDVETVRDYLEEEWRAAFDAFDSEVGGTDRHKECHSTSRGGYYPALAIGVIGHHYVPEPDEYAQPYWFSISVTASYCPPLK